MEPLLLWDNRLVLLWESVCFKVDKRKTPELEIPPFSCHILSPSPHICHHWKHILSVCVMGGPCNHTRQQKLFSLKAMERKPCSRKEMFHMALSCPHGMKTTEPAASQPKPHLFYTNTIMLQLFIHFTRSAVCCSGATPMGFKFFWCI